MEIVLLALRQVNELVQLGCENALQRNYLALDLGDLGGQSEVDQLVTSLLIELDLAHAIEQAF